MGADREGSLQVPEVTGSHQEALRVGTSWLEGFLQDGKCRQPGVKSAGMGQVEVVVGTGREAWAPGGQRGSPLGVATCIAGPYIQVMADGHPVAPR